MRVVSAAQGSALKANSGTAGEVQLDGDRLVSNQPFGAADLVEHFRHDFGQIVAIGGSLGDGHGSGRGRGGRNALNAGHSGGGSQGKQFSTGHNLS